MAGQDVVVTYRADVSQLTGELNKIIAAQEEITKDQKAANAEVNKNLNSQQFAAKKRLELLKLEEKELAKLKQLRKLAFDPKVIQDYDSKISAATKNIELLGDKTKQALGGIGGQIKSIGLGIGAGIAAAFSVQAIIQFGKASVNAFLEAEENANRLKFAITTIAGESEVAFDRLIAQSAELQKITIFSDDSIQQAQTALAQFGLTADQIENLIPRLADFATITSQDIPSAAAQIGAALEGNGREFKKYGIEVDAASSRTENLNSILDGLVKFQGAASEATNTLTGQLKQQENAADDLQETVGEKLAPAFVKFKKAAFEGILTLIDDFERFSKGDFSQLFVRDGKTIEATIGAISNKIREQENSLKESGIAQKEASEQAVNAVRSELLANVQYARSQFEKASLIKDIDKALLKGYVDRLKFANDELSLLYKYIDAKNQSAEVSKEDTSRLISLAELQKKKTEELISLKEKESDIDDNAAKKNIKNIESIIDARNKAFEEYKKNLELLRALEIKNQPDERIQLEAQFGIDVSKITATGKLRNQIIEQLQIDLNAKLKALDDKETQDEKQEYSDREAALQASLDKKKQIAEDYYRQAQKLLTDAFIQETAALPEPEKRKVAESFEAELRRDEVAAIKAIDNDLEASDDDRQNRRIIVAQETTNKIADLYEALGLSLKESAESGVVTWINQNQAILQSSMDLMSSLQALSQQYTSNRIDEINKLKDEQIAAIDTEQSYVSEQLKKRRISETEAAKLSEELTAKKLATEKRAAEKEQALKKKQFEIDKAAALVKIIINTAIGVSENIGIPVLAALIAAAGAAEGALVASQPNPYKKGTKSAKKGLARVGEEGEEIMYVPGGAKVLPNDKTVTYGSVLDKMFDGTFDKYYMKREIAPRMVAQRKVHEQTKEKSFARNISESIVFNQQGLTSYELEQVRRKGQNINNADEIGRSVARHLQSDPYRR